MDVFGGAPRFLAYPRPVVVQSGTDAVLKCQISGIPDQQLYGRETMRRFILRADTGCLRMAMSITLS